MPSETERPKPHSRILGALAGAFAGFFIGIIVNILVYTISDRGVAIGWANSMYGGVLIGAFLVRCEFSLMQTLIRPIAFICTFLLLVGCTPSSGPAPASPQPRGFVTVVGDATAKTVADKFDASGIKTSTTLDDQADSALIIVVQDSSVGPLPIHLEIAQALRKRPHAEYLWIFTNTDLVDDQELLELEELECREIFNGQQLPGDDVTFAFDTVSAPVRSDYACPKGWDAIIRHVKRSMR